MVGLAHMRLLKVPVIRLLTAQLTKQATKKGKRAVQQTHVPLDFTVTDEHGIPVLSQSVHECPHRQQLCGVEQFLICSMCVPV